MSNLSTVTKGVRSTDSAARLAWLGVVFTPVVFVAGFVLAYALGGLIGANVETEMTFWQNIVVYVPTSIVVLSAPVFGLANGITAACAGSRSGLLAAVVAGLLAAFLVGMIILGM